jgi:hypothetical protein
MPMPWHYGNDAHININAPHFGKSSGQSCAVDAPLTTIPVPVPTGQQLSIALSSRDNNAICPVQVHAP